MIAEALVVALPLVSSKVTVKTLRVVVEAVALMGVEVMTSLLGADSALIVSCRVPR